MVIGFAGFSPGFKTIETWMISTVIYSESKLVRNPHSADIFEHFSSENVEFWIGNVCTCIFGYGGKNMQLLKVRFSLHH